MIFWAIAIAIGQQIYRYAHPDTLVTQWENLAILYGFALGWLVRGWEARSVHVEEGRSAGDDVSTRSHAP